jgi:hypothetical protein
MDAEPINSRPVILISFDIDGTVEGGDPSGPVPLEFVRRAVALGALVGSSSDRTIADQRRFWRAGQVRTGFIVLKQQLPELKARYPCRRYLHIGDSMVDEYYAGVAGFEFWNARSLARSAADQRLSATAMSEYLLDKLAVSPPASTATRPAPAPASTVTPTGPEPGRPAS